MDEFEKDRQKRVGERGHPIFAREQQTTDLEEMREKTVETTGTCYCGRPLLEEAAVRRCVACDLVCCQSCQVVVRRQIVCQSCAEQAYGLDKDVFLTLYLLDKDLVAADHLVEVITDPDGIPIEVHVDAAAQPLLENRYIDEEGSVTPLGQEALQVGQQLYGDDGDVKQVIQDAEIRSVVER